MNASKQAPITSTDEQQPPQTPPALLPLFLTAFITFGDWPESEVVLFGFCSPQTFHFTFQFLWRAAIHYNSASFFSSLFPLAPEIIDILVNFAGKFSTVLAQLLDAFSSFVLFTTVEDEKMSL